jgi:hypothetical protein
MEEANLKSNTRAEGFLMPIALIILVLDITLVYHSVRTGRARPWAFIILAAPLIGSVAYIGRAGAGMVLQPRGETGAQAFR